MPIRQDQDSRPEDPHEAEGQSSQPAAVSSPVRSSAARPSTVYRAAESETAPAGDSRAGAALKLVEVIGSALVVGIGAGFLELAVKAAQTQIFHRVGWSTLKISRHIGWMVPVAETGMVLLLALALIGPVLAWTALRKKREGAAGQPAWVWDWAGTVLGALLFFGPILAIRGIYAWGALVLAIGAGFRMRGWIVRATPRWKRSARWAGAAALVFLPSYSTLMANSITGATENTWLRPGTPAPNLLWIVMDTVRADRMSLYGYKRETTPQLEKWAREGITFDMARSAAPWTLPSHLTMFTGLWPNEHGGRVDRPYYKSAPTLAEHLRQQGYATGGIAANVGMCNASYGVGRGFDYYMDFPCNHEISVMQTMRNSSLSFLALCQARRFGWKILGTSLDQRRLAPEIIGNAETWIDRVKHSNAEATPEQQRPFFLFMNFMDVHGPYLPSPRVPRKFYTGVVPAREQARPECGWQALETANNAPSEHKAERRGEYETMARQLNHLYDECLYGLDTEIDGFLNKLRAQGVLENTWVVITADHGEHFGEHGLFGHGGSLYNELTHVPLLLIPPLSKAPGNDPNLAARGRRVTGPVSLRNLPHTLTEVLGAGSANPFPGRSLARHWTSATPQPFDPVLSQLEQQHLEGEDVKTADVVTMDSVIDEDHVMIDISFKGTELYNLFGDPNQERDLANTSAEQARQQRLTKTLNALRRNTGHPTKKKAATAAKGASAPESHSE